VDIKTKRRELVEQHLLNTNPNDNPSQHGVTFMEGCYTSSYDVSHRDKIQCVSFTVSLRTATVTGCPDGCTCSVW